MKVLMVCLGNICRSPLAHGILVHKVKASGLNWEVDSAGTNGFHNDELPDPRSISKAGEYGMDLTYQRSRQITKQDLDYFDIIYVMDASNFQNVLRICDTEMQRDKIKMIMNCVTPGQNVAVPDPYYGGEDGFENVYQMLEEACEAIITQHQS